MTNAALRVLPNLASGRLIRKTEPRNTDPISVLSTTISQLGKRICAAMTPLLPNRMREDMNFT